MSDSTELGWVIELYRSSRLHYWNGTFLDDRGWSTDSLKAVRFARYEDASKVQHWLLGGIGNCTQHAWG